MKLSVVIPAYNEEDNIKQALLDVTNEFPEAEIIVVNDASTDRTKEIVDNLKLPNLTILTNTMNWGHGPTVVRGLKEATGDYILYIDADRQIALSNFDMGGYDIISGWRIHRQDKLFRKIISFGLKMTIWIWYGYKVKDANCPFKIYKRKTIQPLLEQLTFATVPIADLEVLAREAGLLVATISTPHLPYQGIRQGFLQGISLKTLRFTWYAFVEIINL